MLGGVYFFIFTFSRTAFLMQCKHLPCPCGVSPSDVCWVISRSLNVLNHKALLLRLLGITLKPKGVLPRVSGSLKCGLTHRFLALPRCGLLIPGNSFRYSDNIWDWILFQGAVFFFLLNFLSILLIFLLYSLLMLHLVHCLSCFHPITTKLYY